MARLRILHADLSEIGGAELLLADQARWFAAQGHDVRVAALRGTGDAWRRPFAGLDVRVVARPPKIERLGVADMAPLVAAARDALADADAVLAHNFPAAPIAVLAAPPSARVTWYCHEPYRALHPAATFPAAAARAAAGGFDDGPTRQYARRARRRRWAELLLPWRAARRRALAAWDAEHVARLHTVVANSGFSAQMVRHALGRTADAIVPPAIAFGPPGPPRGPIDRTRPQVLAMTRLGVPKQVDRLVDAIGRLRATVPGAHLHVAGDGPQRTALEAHAARVAPGGVTFHGHVAREALDALTARCDLFALMPADEPFGMVFPEAASRGLLLVGPDHGGPAEIVGDVGETCDAFDAAAIAAAMARTLAYDDATIAARRARADAVVRARYAPEVVLPELARWVFGAP
ncbi:MAG: glycosyltransferase family 4 protein [Gemmatimonadaceae bacterium]|nr:glycosyltransferase family 4 protein [Gemmatimonadaceae bacterium]